MNDWLGARFLKEIERFVISPVARSLDETLTSSFLDFDNSINLGESLCSYLLIVSYQLTPNSSRHTITNSLVVKSGKSSNGCMHLIDNDPRYGMQVFYVIIIIYFLIDCDL